MLVFLIAGGRRNNAPSRKWQGNHSTIKQIS